MFYEAMSLTVVALLWGITNPIIKRNSKDIVNIEASSKIVQFMMEVRYLLTNVQYLIPMALNQLGSLLYFITLQHVDLTLTVPVANSLTFVFTALSGWFLNEQLPKISSVLGILFILFGTFLCCLDKYINEGTS